MNMYPITGMLSENAKQNLDLLSLRNRVRQNANAAAIRSIHTAPMQSPKKS